MACKFCEDYAEEKRIAKDIEERDKDCTMDVQLKLASRHVDKDGNTRGVYTHGWYDINFCPVCGKSLKGEKL